MFYRDLDQPIYRTQNLPFKPKTVTRLSSICLEQQLYTVWKLRQQIRRLAIYLQEQPVAYTLWKSKFSPVVADLARLIVTQISKWVETAT